MAIRLNSERVWGIAIVVLFLIWALLMATGCVADTTGVDLSKETVMTEPNYYLIAAIGVILVVLRLMLPKSLDQLYRKRRAAVPKFNSVWEECAYLAPFTTAQRNRYYREKWIGLYSDHMKAELQDAIDDQIKRWTR